MTQISKRVLKEKVEERIIDLFWTSISSLSTKDRVSLFLDDLLTPTEKIMLSKRLAIAFMLTKGYSYPVINDLLRVSDSTIWNVKASLTFKGKGYRTVISEIMKKEKWGQFWQGLNDFFEEALPPGRYGTDWKEARRKQWERRRKEKKAF